MTVTACKKMKVEERRFRYEQRRSAASLHHLPAPRHDYTCCIRLRAFST